ncbi:Imidazole glycerol phosphate synthase subunit HisH [Thalassocella blandensis]|nr:Imidazole glycerol phosphate synthase subunit HisH [Thalassocella blandensis]
MSKQHIAVIDYGMGNLHSVASALSKVAPEAKISITGEKHIIEDADRVVFPGVGAIRDCMAEIRRLDVDKTVDSVIRANKPLLAICVGMQSLMRWSEENKGVDCLDVFPGQVKFFSSNPEFLKANDEAAPSGERLKVPHMGWNTVKQVAHPLWQGIEDNSRFYFVHSYYVNLEQSELMAGSTHFGIEFTAAIARENIFAVQFHPEKSHANGLQLLRNFVQWNGVQ